jgi:hypothetical protein
MMLRSNVKKMVLLAGVVSISVAFGKAGIHAFNITW